MKYIRTKDGIFDNRLMDGVMPERISAQSFGIEAVKYADTIEELCDGICAIERNGKLKVPYVGKTAQDLKVIIDLIDKDNYEVYGAIWTDKGLKYVAKMNEKGELELL